MPVPEFSEKEVELINMLKDKGFCPETQGLCGAWEDTEKQKPEWEDVEHGPGTEKNREFLLLQARLNLKKAKMLNAADMVDEANDAVQEVYEQIEAMERGGIECAEFRAEVDNLW